MTSPWLTLANAITDPTRTPDDFPVLREDFPSFDLDQIRRARIEADVENALSASMDARPAGSGLCDDQGCGRPSPDGCGKCQSARPKLRIVKEGER